MTIHTRLNRRLMMTLLGASALPGAAWAAEGAAPAAAPSAGARPPRKPGREHTDFLHSQTAFGRTLDPKNSKPGVATNILSYDFLRGAITVMFRYPVGWKYENAHWNSADEEILVLEGELTLNDVTLKAGDYAYIPVGFWRIKSSSPKGATVLTMYDDKHVNAFEQPPAGTYKKDLLISRLDTNKLKWKKAAASLTSFNKAGEMKLLRKDPNDGEETFLLKVAKDDPKKVTQRPVAMPDMVEEIYVLDGEIATPKGVMRSGSYAWRVPGREIGPYGTKTGFTALVRSKQAVFGQGPATQKITFGAEKPIVWDAKFDPEIPDNTRQFWDKPIPDGMKY